MLSARHNWAVTRIVETYEGLDNQTVSTALTQKDNWALFEGLLDGDPRLPKLFIHYQIADAKVRGGIRIPTH